MALGKHEQPVLGGWPHSTSAPAEITGFLEEQRVTALAWPDNLSFFSRANSVRVSSQPISARRS